MTPERLTALRELCEKATGGIWESDGLRVFAFSDASDDPEHVLYIASLKFTNDTNVSVEESIANTELIAASRQVLPDLLDEVDRLQEACKMAVKALYRCNEVMSLKQVAEVGIIGEAIQHCQAAQEADNDNERN